MNPAELVGIVLAVASALAGLIVWIVKALLEPLQRVVENNTRVMERIESKLDEHAGTLDEYGNRITKMETKHQMIHGEKE